MIKMKQTLLTICLILFALPSWGDKIMKCEQSNHTFFFKLEENWFSKNKFYMRNFDGLWQPFCNIDKPYTKSVDFHNLEEEENLYLKIGEEPYYVSKEDEEKYGLKNFKITPTETDPKTFKYKQFYQYMDEVAICDIQQDDDSRYRQIIDFETVSSKVIVCTGSPLINLCKFEYDYPVNYDCKIQD